MTNPETPKVRQGEATAAGDQLPKGGAEATNEGYAQAQAAQTQAAAQPQTAQPQNAGNVAEPVLTPRPSQGAVPLQNEDENLLFGPTSRPLEHVTTGTLPGNRTELPPHINAMIPTLQQAAQDPDAPPQLKGLLQLLLDQMNQA